MKTSDDEVLDGMPAGGSLAASEQNCPKDRSLSVPVSAGDKHCSAAPTAEVENEVIELLRQHAAALSRYAVTIARDSTIVQDAIQEAFLRYFIARVGGQHVENPRAWLFRVLRNYILDCNRKSNSMRAVELEKAVRVADSRQDVEAGYQQHETLRHAVSSLSPREQECMQLRLEGFGYDEIAHILKIRSGTVGALLARGLKKIRKTGLF
jgi:RNA polymerase sigma-70 factor (ECF subfamily)